MSKIDKTYQDLLHKIYNTGFEYEDPNRKGTIRKQIPYYTLEHKFEDGFPIIGLKQTYPKMAFNEMKAFMMGVTNLKELEDLGVTFWRKDAYNYYLNVCEEQGIDRIISFELFISYIQKAKDLGELLDDSFKNSNVEYPIIPKNYILGDLGKIYSHQIRKWNREIDQLNEVLERIKREPNSTKNIVTMWNPSDMNSCALSPCHTRFSFIVETLSTKQRDKIYTEQGNSISIDGVNIDKAYNDWFDKMEIPKYGLTIQWNQDSVDTFLGLPINIQYYSFVCYIFAHYLGMKPLGILGNLTNCHLYDNSWDSVKEILNFNPDELENIKIKTNFSKDWSSLDNYLQQLDFNQLSIKNYKHLGRFNVEMLPYNK